MYEFIVGCGGRWKTECIGLFPEILSMSDGGSEDTNRRSAPGNGSNLDLLVSLVMSGAFLSSIRKSNVVSKQQ